MIFLFLSLFKVYVAPGIIFFPENQNNNYRATGEFYGLMSGGPKDLFGLLEVRGFASFQGEARHELFVNRAFVRMKAKNIEVFGGKDTYSWAFENMFTPYDYLNPEIVNTGFYIYKKGIPALGVKFYGKNMMFEFMGVIRKDQAFAEEKLHPCGRLYLTDNNFEFQIPFYVGSYKSAGLGLRSRAGSVTYAADISFQLTETRIFTNFSSSLNFPVGDNLLIDLEYLFAPEFYYEVFSSPLLLSFGDNNFYLSLSWSRERRYMSLSGFCSTNPDVLTLLFVPGLTMGKAEFNLLIGGYLIDFFGSKTKNEILGAQVKIYL